VNERFGADYIADVLKGNRTAAVERWGHDRLSTFALMNTETKVYIQVHDRTARRTGFSSEAGRVLDHRRNGGRPPTAQGRSRPVPREPVIAAKKQDIEKKRKVRRSEEWEGIDERLFEVLRAKRTELSVAKASPPTSYSATKP